MKSARLTSLWLALLCGCGGPLPRSVEEEEQPLLQGRSCEAEEHPGTVIVETGSGGVAAGFCTGTVIAPDVVLTAAHCIRGPEAKIFFQDRAAGRSIASTKVVTHPDFHQDRSLDGNGVGLLNDIALVFLAELAPVQPEIMLSLAETHLLTAGIPVAIAGFGSTTAPNEGVGFKKCGSAILGFKGGTEMRIDPDKTMTNTCYGDSGGPTFITVGAQSIHPTRVVGVLSHFALPKSDCTVPWSVTRVDAYLDWIQANLMDACADKTRIWCEKPGLPSQCLTLASATPTPTFTDDCGVPKKPRCGQDSVGLPALLAAVTFLRRRTRRATSGP